MNIKWLAFSLIFLLPAGVAHSQEGMVTIMSPKAGAKLSGMGPHQLQYEVIPGPNGDHVHIYVDNAEVGILRALKGSYPLEGLSPGMRNICIKVVNKGHTPIGVDGCVKASVSSLSGGNMPTRPKSSGYGY